jgi:hypothetical protein
MCELRKVLKLKSGSWEGALSHHQLILTQLPVTSTITNFIGSYGCGNEQWTSRTTHTGDDAPFLSYDE